MTRVCEYLVYINGVPQFIMLARVMKSHENAFDILINHKGKSVQREDVSVAPRSRVQRSVWEEFAKRQRGGMWTDRYDTLARNA